MSPGREARRQDKDMLTGSGLGIPDIVFMLALLGFAFWKKGWIRIILTICIIIWGVFAVQYDIKVAAPLLTIGIVLFIMSIMNLIGRMREERDSG
jgi:hypothetical protein